MYYKESVTNAQGHISSFSQIPKAVTAIITLFINLSSWFFYCILIVFAVYVCFVVQFLRYRKVQPHQEELAHSLIERQEKERKRIASELHDSIGQDILILKNMALIGLRSKKDTKVMAIQLQEISKYASQTLKDIREISQNLRPILLDRLGLTESLKYLIENMTIATHLDVTTSLDQIDNLLNKESEINLFRIIQESLNNIIKHSHATRVNVEIARDRNIIHVTIADNGKGFNKVHTGKNRSSGLGLVVIEERVKMLNGTWELNSSCGNGTSIIVNIPFKTE